MRFKTDENLPQQAAELLRTAGFDAMSVYDQDLGGEIDGNLIEICGAEDRVMVTLDLDFADIRAYPPSQHQGIIVLRLKRQDKVSVLELLKRLVELLKDGSAENQLWIVDEKRVRIRE